LAIGERHQEIGELGVAVLLHEFRDIVTPAAAARLADDPERRRSNVGQGECAVAGHMWRPDEMPLLDLALRLGGNAADLFSKQPNPPKWAKTLITGYLLDRG
jgi:hypothetical protein